MQCMICTMIFIVYSTVHAQWHGTHTVENLLRRIVRIHYSAVHALHYCTTYRVLEWILTGRTWV